METETQRRRPDSGSSRSARRARLGAPAVAASLFLGLLAAGCEPATPVYLLTVDTLRPDHLSVYGYDRDTAPAIASLAEDGVVFMRAFTTSPKTTPAYASMFTGLYPHEHGLATLGQALPTENETLAEILRRSGYRNGGFVSSTVMISRLSDLDQGFELWDDYLPSKEKNRENFERHAPQTIDAAFEWMSTRAGRDGKTFLFVHLIDPHGPYTPPPGLRARFTRGGGPRLEPSLVPVFQRLAGATTLGDYIDAYDGEIAHADGELGRLLNRLRAEGIYDDALIILAADHGESFGSDGVYFRHGVTLAEASTRIPLIIKPPRGSLIAAATVDTPASLVDILPTVLDYLGVDAPRDLDGISLRPLIEGRRPPAERIVFSTRKVHGTWHYAAHGQTRSLRDIDPSAINPVTGRPGRDAKTLEPGDRETLSAALAAHLRSRAKPRRSHAAVWRYRPTDKRFVQRFVEAHNGVAVADDLANLRALGYVE